MFRIPTVVLALTICAAAASLAPAAGQPVQPAQPFPTAEPPTSAVPTPLPELQLPPVPQVAPGYKAPPVTAPPSELIGVTQSPFVGLRLEDAISMALAKNTDIAVAQENRKIAQYQIVAAKGAYDVQFMVAPNYTHQVIPPVSAFQAGPNGGPITQDTLGGNASLTGTLQSTGTQVQVSSSNERVTSNLTVNSFNPYYESALSVNLTQPLLRGFASDSARRQIELAEANAAGTDAAVQLQASNTIVTIEDAYWDLVAAWRNVAIQNEGLRNALAQAQTTQRSATAGRNAPIDVTESNSQVAVFQDNVLSALENVQRLQTQLKTLILDTPSDPIWTANLVPTSNVGDVPPEPTLDDVIVQALRNRPEIAQLREQLSGADVTLAYARDQLKPTVNLQLGYTTNGFAGEPTSLAANPLFAALGPQIAGLKTPSYLNGGFATDWNNLANNAFPLYSAQVNVQIPIGNRVAKGNYGVAQSQAQALQVQQVALIQRIKSEALNALQTLREARYRLTATGIARATAQQVYESEQRRFAAGTSTTFLVLQRELELANDRGRELQAQTDLNKAVVELQRVTGQIVSQSGFDIQKVGSGALGDLNAALTADPTHPTPGAAR